MNCLLAGNSTGQGGDGHTNWFIGNGSASGGNGGSGSGCWSAGGMIANCTILANTLGGGGGVDSAPGLPGTNGAGGGVWSSNGVVVNCILWNDATNELAGTGFQVSYSDVEGGTGQPWFDANSCLDADPLLASPAMGNFHLTALSPCINSGLNQPWMITATDLDGNPCVLQGTVDVGALEFVAAVPPGPRFTGMGTQSSTNFWLEMRGTPSAVCTLQVSSNLMDWTTLSTSGLGINGLWEFVDQDRQRYPRRFYRAVQWPMGTVYATVTADMLTSPFVFNNNCTYQPIETDTPSGGGRMGWQFTISQAGSYVIQAQVDAPRNDANSLFVNIDAEPQDPYMIWDIPITSGFESRTASWRGNGTFDNNEFVPQVFNLTQGSHQLIIRGREAWTSLQSLTIVRVSDFGSNATAGMAPIPAGTFTMGNSIGDADISDAAATTATVSAFYMDTNLVSYSQWQAIYSYATNHGYGFDNAGSGKAANHPVQRVNWCDVVKWCNARSQEAGLTPVYYLNAGMTQVYTIGQVTNPYVQWSANGYRLPTEAEWEKAARGGLSGQRFPWGNTINESQANYYGNTADYTYDLGPSGFNATYAVGMYPYTSPVGAFGANGYGLYDIAGNVFEWCWDWYGTPYAGGTDPRGPASSPLGSRVIRGGGWFGDAHFARCANRSNSTPVFAGDGFGFRCVRGL